MSAMKTNDIDVTPILSYLCLPPSYEPSPRTAPIQFLHKHVRELPPHLLALFSATLTPKERTAVPAIRNRRLQYTYSRPSELSLVNAKSTWPALWQGRERPGQEQRKEEQDWAQNHFLGGSGSGNKQHVGKLGALLGEYEEERESERVRTIRRQRTEYFESLPEEDEESDEEEDGITAFQDMSIAETEETFLRVVKESFIYGFLESIDYDKVDWDEAWDGDLDRDIEERWFDNEEES